MERSVITSRQNPLVRSVCGLAEKKIRAKEGLFRFDGIKLLREALDSPVDIKHVVYRVPASDGVAELLASAVKQGRIPPEAAVAVSGEVFDKISEEKSPEGIITVAKMLSGLHLKVSAVRGAETVMGVDRILIAESLRDPGNLGTVIRSCFALGIETLVLTDDCADIYNAKTLRAAMGGIFKLNTVTVPCTELGLLIGALRENGRKVYAAALSEDSRSIEDVCLGKGDCFVIGNEGHGLSQNVIDACTASVIIPMREDAESLNAAAAAAICIWETVRKK